MALALLAEAADPTLGLAVAGAPFGRGERGFGFMALYGFAFFVVLVWWVIRA